MSPCVATVSIIEVGVFCLEVHKSRTIMSFHVYSFAYVCGAAAMHSAWAA